LRRSSLEIVEAYLPISSGNVSNAVTLSTKKSDLFAFREAVVTLQRRRGRHLAEQLYDGGQQVNGEDEEIAHVANVPTNAGDCKTVGSG
jgi:hypothetical protein